MNRQLIHWLVALVLVLSVHLEASAQKNANKRIRETDALIRLLEEPILLKDLKDGASFASLEEWVQTRGKELAIFVDVKAFQEESSLALFRGELPPPKLLGLPRRMRVGDLLQLIVAQLEEESTLLIRKNRVEITSKKAASRENLLKQTFVASFEQHPLEFVLDDLADITGLSVIVDGRCKEKIRTPVTARFRNDVPLRDALRMVTESAELKLVILPGGLFVTTPTLAASAFRLWPVHFKTRVASLLKRTKPMNPPTASVKNMLHPMPKT
ncbi:MAG: hypothetical protein HYR84_05390 [Planctomycetes bacterium]|nr:hypothetical protein [Planctomycetota bacterium]